MTPTRPFWETHLILLLLRLDWPLKPLSPFLPSTFRVLRPRRLFRCRPTPSPQPRNQRSPIHFIRSRRPGAPLAPNVSLSERGSVACPEKEALIRTSHCSSKQRIKVVTLLPPLPPQNLLGQCVALLVEVATRVAWRRPLCRRFSPAIIKGRPRPLRASTSTTSLNRDIPLSL